MTMQVKIAKAPDGAWWYGFSPGRWHPYSRDMRHLTDEEVKKYAESIAAGEDSVTIVTWEETQRG
jgi:hypothetical protein